MKSILKEKRFNMNYHMPDLQYLIHQLTAANLTVAHYLHRDDCENDKECMQHIIERWRIIYTILENQFPAKKH